MSLLSRHLSLGRVAGGNHRVAQNDEPEPTTDPLQPESPTDYAQRRARENDRRALDLQLQVQAFREGGLL